MAQKKKQEPEIAKRIREARERANLQPAELRAKLKDKGIELSKTGLHRLETVEPINPNLEIIKAIAQVTHSTPGWILFGTGTATPGDEVGQAIRARVLDTIELMAGAVDMTAQQEKTFERWLQSVRKTTPSKIQKP